MCLSLFTSPITNKPFLAAGYENGSVMLWDVTAGKALSNSLVHTESGEIAASRLKLDRKVYTCNNKQP